MARQASARVLLALAAVAVLALAGCGGGGDSSSGQATSTGTASQQGQAAAAEDTTASAGNAKQGSGSSNPAKPQSSNSQNSSPNGVEVHAKHGSQVKLPKGEPEPQATPAEQAQATVADLSLSSPALGSSGEATLPAPYTCDGADTSPPLEWQGVPTGSTELVLFAMNTQPVGGKLFFDWAVAGISPELSGLEAGKLPAGAVQGRNSAGKVGYSICPPQGTAETYVFALYALPKSLSPAKGFDPHALREAVLAQAGHAGLLAVGYGRP